MRSLNINIELMETGKEKISMISAIRLPRNEVQPAPIRRGMYWGSSK